MEFGADFARRPLLSWTPLSHHFGATLGRRLPAGRATGPRARCQRREPAGRPPLSALLAARGAPRAAAAAAAAATAAAASSPLAAYLLCAIAPRCRRAAAPVRGARAVDGGRRQ